jgi:isoleucyl-tRNA synthetase
MTRVKEIVDVWFDSGAMPFASGADYPADYIAEGVDQTRGWFYTLLAVGVLLDKGRPYKNVISLGHVLDKNGQKMSKSKGNIVDPWQMVNRYGVDTIRWYFYTINSPGEPKKFDEADLAKVLRQFVLLVYNSFVFFDIYAKKPNLINQKIKVINVLDKWILIRLNETIIKVTKNLDNYDIASAAKTIEEFINDLSRWYIRRSRKRFSVVFKGYNKGLKAKDYFSASETLGYVLFNLSKLLAPFMPFFAEALYKSLVKDDLFLSVHLENWPNADFKLKADDLSLLKEMAEIRRLASLVLAKRAEAKIKVRQPLQKLKIKNLKIKIRKELLEILKDEVNVKEIEIDSKLKEEIWLDTNLTHQLKEEGWLREIIRLVQDLRQEARLQPKDKIILAAVLPPELNYLFEKNEKFIKTEINAEKIEYKRLNKFDVELETKLDEWLIWLALIKR